MKRKIRLLLGIGVILSIGSLYAKQAPFVDSMPRDADGYICITHAQQVSKVYPKTAQEISDRSEAARDKSLEIIEAIIACPAEEQNQKTMLRAYDRITAYIGTEQFFYSLVRSIHPDEAVRKEASKQYVACAQFLTKQVKSNQRLCQAFVTYAQGNAVRENLCPEDRYLLKNIMDDFKRDGLTLPEAQQAQVLVRKNRCSELEAAYSENMDSDATTIVVCKEDLAGVAEDVIVGLPRQADRYVLAMNYPTQTMIMDYCSVEATRKAYYFAFKNRGYPANVAVLQELLATRDEFAKLLGFESYAHYNLSSMMVKTPERAWEFENNLCTRALQKVREEFALLTADLPAGISVRPDGLLEPWNTEYAWSKGYVGTHYMKNRYDFDEREYAEYFPYESTVQGLISVYEQFFSLEIKKVPVTDTWHEDVELLEVRTKVDGAIRGYIFLDMFPRQNKYGHAAQFRGVRGLKKDDGTYYPCVVTLVCNFTKPLQDKPSLLGAEEVGTFFHEFGHAIHSVLGAAKYSCYSGTATVTDFVELPSQMLENWLEDREILKMISSHYQTGKPLPDELITKRLEVTQFGKGMFVARQLMLGMVALSYHGAGKDKDLAALYRKYSELCIPSVPYYDDEHAYCSFTHLPGYGAGYYGYLWAESLAQDVFSVIKEQGLLNPEVGKKYADAILSHGGGKDANELLRDFLGREPNSDAFYKKMGL